MIIYVSDEHKCVCMLCTFYVTAGGLRSNACVYVRIRLWQIILIMIDHSNRVTKPVVAHASAAAVGCRGNCHDVTSRGDDAREHDGLGAGRVRMSSVNDDGATIVPTYYTVVAEAVPPRSTRPVDDRELAADAEVCWLLRNVAAETPSIPKIQQAIAGLGIGSDEAPLVAFTAPDFDTLPPYLAPIPASCCRLRSPSRTACSYVDTRRRPCLNFDKMQV